jgi:predicted CXXCH cytochrome family protein
LIRHNAMQRAYRLQHARAQRLTMRAKFSCSLLVLSLIATGAVAAPAKPAAKPAATPAAKAPAPKAPAKPTKAPLPGTPRWSHAPFEAGNCGLCHERKDPKSPGKVVGDVNQLCYSCHDEFGAAISKRTKVHSPVKRDCISCHNAHNSQERKLLLTDMATLCFSCHETTKGDAMAAVNHAPVIEGAKCMNCHNPHASNFQGLLLTNAFDLCVNCHGKDGMKDSDGKEMTNFKKLLAQNKVHHKPVANKDCSACHVPHGGENFRLLLEEYPAAFYAPYDPKNYALCFECHKSEMIRDEQTTTLTNFRDGSRNLHYLHVNNPERGRTCRSCHEVHAAQNPHIIRDQVPYGSRGWMLNVGFKKTDTGGTCAKTCHGDKPYNNGRKAPAKPAAPGKAPADPPKPGKQPPVAGTAR